MQWKDQRENAVKSTRNTKLSKCIKLHRKVGGLSSLRKGDVYCNHSKNLFIHRHSRVTYKPLIHWSLLGNLSKLVGVVSLLKGTLQCALIRTSYRLACTSCSHSKSESPPDGFNFVGLQQVPFICACVN